MNNTKKILIMLSFISILITFHLSLVYAAAGLSVATDKNQYSSGESVTIYGTLTNSGIPVSNGLVGIEVRDPDNNLITARTVNSGSDPTGTPYIELYTVIPCNETGDPISSLEKGNSFIYFRVTGASHDIEMREALVVVRAYTPNNTPYSGWSFGPFPIAPKDLPSDPAKFFTVGPISMPIDMNTPVGEWTVYASVFTDWPRNLVSPGIHGTPYCPEVSATFEITGSGSPPEDVPAADPPSGNYNTDFVLSTSEGGGTYSVYASSMYFGSVAYSSDTFEVVPWYLKADFNGDQKVDWQDLFEFVGAYISYFEDPNSYLPKYDFNLDGQINYNDLFEFIGCYIAYFES